MENELRIDLPKQFGCLRVYYREGKVTRINLGKGAIGSRARRGGVSPGAGRDEALEGRLRRDFRAYFRGEPVIFDYPLDLDAYTAFQQAVWAAMREIPYGQTRSYRWIAERIGKPGAARAVGNACGRNPLPIIQPCHRVVGSKGRLGGFSGGLDLKKALLRLEGTDLSSLR
jgi:methylated-DNA-[protein]-cysteine S-methyltransferase